MSRDLICLMPMRSRVSLIYVTWYSILFRSFSSRSFDLPYATSISRRLLAIVSLESVVRELTCVSRSSKLQRRDSMVSEGVSESKN